MPAVGHVNPTLALVAELVRRGHRVTYAVGPRLVPAVTNAGAEPLVLPTEIRLPKLAGGFTLEGVESLLRFYVDDARECLPQLVRHFRSDPPDAVCYDSMAVVGAMLGETLDLPRVATFANFASHENFALNEVVHTGPALDPPSSTITRFAADMGELAARYGISTPGSPLDGAQPAPLNLVFLPRRFQPAADTFDDRFLFVGPQIGDRDLESWRPADPNAPLLFISLGTAFSNRPDFYRTCMRAFGDSRWQVAMSVGDQVDIAELGPIPDNVDVRAWFPQLAVLAHATAFLSHAGMNSTMESLYYGVPLIGVPQMPEQAANAARVDELGLGRRLDPATISVEQLRATVNVVISDPAIHANLATMQSEIRQCGGTAAGADAIEAQLSR
jgi:MGT family glycosyltransferase